MPRIAIVWDFDGTLSPIDSTSKVIEVLGDGPDQFWKVIKSLRGDRQKPKWEHVLASDAPIWMYSLALLANKRKVPLNPEFFREFVLPFIPTYDSATELLPLRTLRTHPSSVLLTLRCITS